MAGAIAVPPGAALKIFNYTICPYCCKAKALLRFLEVAYAPVEVSPLTKSQISWSKDYRKVPIAVFDDGLVVKGSDAIVDELLARYPAPESFQNPESRKWAAWATNELAVYMYPNMTRSFDECRAALAYVHSGNFGWMESMMIKNIGAFGMFMAHEKIKKKYGIQDERTALWGQLDQWIEELSSSTGEFRSSKTTPDLGDVAVFGTLKAAANVPLIDEIKSRDCRLSAWMEAMEEALPAPKLVK